MSVAAQAHGRSRYRAFISYSQANKAIAKSLQDWLEAFRAPKTLGGTRIGKIFRDDADLAGAADLGAALKANIADSQALIVLCSPQAALSRWVDAEIHHFRETGRGDTIFAVILDGTPNSGDPTTECFPPSFREANGIEPLAVDLRNDGRDRAFTRLAAGLLAMPFDDLWQRERRRQRQRIQLLSAAAASFAVLGVAAVYFGVTAQNNAQLAERRAAAISVESSEVLLDEGRSDAALLVLLEAEKVYRGQRAPDALLVALDQATERAAQRKIYPLPADSRLFDAPNDGVFIADLSTGEISLLTAEGAPKAIARSGGRPTFVGARKSGELVVVREDGKIELGAPLVEIGAFARAPRYDYSPYALAKIALYSDGVLVLSDNVSELDHTPVETFELETRRLSALGFPAGVTTYIRDNGGRSYFISQSPLAADGQLHLAETGADPIEVVDQDLFDRVRFVGCLGLSADQAHEQLFQRFLTALHSDDRAIGGQRCAYRNGVIILSSFNSTSAGILREDWVVSSERPPRAVSGVHFGSHGDGPDFSSPSFVLPIGEESAEFVTISNRDIAIKNNEDSTPIVRRMEQPISYARWLGSGRLALVGAGEAFVTVLDLVNADSDSGQGGENRPRSTLHKAVCEAEPVNIGKLSVTLTRTGDSESTKGLISVRIGDETLHFKSLGGLGCVPISSDGRYLAFPKADHLFSVVDFVNGGVDLGEVEADSFRNATFVAGGPSLLVVTPGGVNVARWDRNQAGLWTKTMAYSGSRQILGAEADSTGRLLVIREALGDGEVGGRVYSIEAEKTWRIIGSYYKWLQVRFSEADEILVARGEVWEPPIKLPTVPELVERAQTLVSERCRTYSGDRYTDSRCWPGAR